MWKNINAFYLVSHFDKIFHKKVHETASGYNIASKGVSINDAIYFFLHKTVLAPTIKLKFVAKLGRAAARDSGMGDHSRDFTK